MLSIRFGVSTIITSEKRAKQNADEYPFLMSTRFSSCNTISVYRGEGRSPSICCFMGLLLLVPIAHKSKYAESLPYGCPWL